MDTSFRKAFPNESRATWVEQQHINDICMDRDNMPLGPGEYSPQKHERHVSTPSVGGSRHLREHFSTFDGSVPSRSGVRTPSKPEGLASSADVAEYKSIFHNHHERDPLDPKTKHCATPGPTQPHEPFLNPLAHDGRRRVRQVHFGPDDIPLDERSTVKEALPSYLIRDEVTKKRLLLCCETREERFLHSSGGRDEVFRPHDPSLCTQRPWREGTLNRKESLPDTTWSSRPATGTSSDRRVLSAGDTTAVAGEEGEEQEVVGGATAIVYRNVVSEAELAERERQRRRRQRHATPKLLLDASCYKRNRRLRGAGPFSESVPKKRGPFSPIQRTAPVSLTPLAINKAIHANPFTNMLTVKREHEACAVPSRMAETLKKYTYTAPETLPVGNSTSSSPM